MSIIKEFFGWGADGVDYARDPEGYFSWQHLLFATIMIAVMVALAILIGRKDRLKGDAAKNRTLRITAIVLLVIEVLKILILCLRSREADTVLYNLPLFLCNIQSIAIPVAAFAKGRVKNAALDFILIFGILGAVMGTYCAGNNYGSYPVLCFDNTVSGITHVIPGFCSLYIAISGMISMKRRNLPVTFAILLFFCGSAAIVNKIIDYNYMFMERGDGTPYDIIYNAFGGNPILYPLGVVGLFVFYILVFYAVYFLIKSAIDKKKGLQ